jgi:peroxiredoxin
MTFLLHALPAVLLAAFPIGQPVDDFQLNNHKGETYSLATYSEQPIIVIAILGTECPLAKLYGPRLQQFSNDYAKQGVTVIGLNANSQDSLADIKAYVQKHDIEFPILRDLENKVVDLLGAKRTPEVFVLDRERLIRYHGRIDDQYGVGYVRDKATCSDLKRAVDELLEGKAVSNPSTESVGCMIGRVKKSQAGSGVTYCNKIAAIFQKHCVQCHRVGDIGPFQMTDYEEIVGWSETISEVIRDERMPPWHANPKYGKFTNTRRMSDDEKQLVFDWVNAGAPYGDKADLPSPRKFVEGWRLPRQPDAVFAMSKRPFRVPSEGAIEYQYFKVDPGFKEDKWIAAAEVIPGNRSVVHHSIVSVRVPKSWGDESMSWLAAYVPGQDINRLESHQAYYVPAGSQLVFQLHYTPTGSSQTDLTQIGVLYADPKMITERVFTMIAMNRNFEIPARAANHRVATTLSGFPNGARLLTLSPHMHLRGKSFQFVLQQASRSEIILDVPNYDSNWQHTYQFSEPVPLDPQTRITCISHFDNSESNLVNPDPNATVSWGEQSWEEMMLAYVGVTVPVSPDKTQPPVVAESEESKATTIAVDRFFKRFDKDGDDRLVRSEMPDSFSRFAFKDFDENKDGAIDRNEAEVQAIKSFKNRKRKRR